MSEQGCSADSWLLPEQESQSEAGALTVTEVMKRAGSNQELLKQLNANLEEDQGLFMQFCDKTKGDVSSIALVFCRKVVSTNRLVALLHYGLSPLACLADVITQRHMRQPPSSLLLSAKKCIWKM